MFNTKSYTIEIKLIQQPSKWWKDVTVSFIFTWPIYRNCFSFHIHIPESASTVKKVRQFLQLTPLNFKPQLTKSDIISPRHRSLSPLGGLGRRKGKKVGWRVEKKKEEVADRRFKVSWWMGGVIGLHLRQVCFSHKDAHLFSFHSGGDAGVKNDKARHWSCHYKELRQLQFP